MTTRDLALWTSRMALCLSAPPVQSKGLDTTP